MNTPWGRAQSKKVLVPGITFYSTASHGGYYVSKAIRAVMPPHLVTEDGWYEEDCDWSKVALAFPHLFTPELQRIARETHARWYEGRNQNEG